MSCRKRRRRDDERAWRDARRENNERPQDRDDDPRYHHWNRSWNGSWNPWNSAAWAGAGWGGPSFRILGGLKRDPWHGKVSGVCAGIAGYYGIRVWLVRALWIVGLCMNPFLAFAAYGIATLFLHPLPAPDRFGGRSETNAGTSAHPEDPDSDLPPELRFASLKDKFREIEGRAGEIETLVTSPEFRLRRDFNKMGKA
jgi:phage shock protein C